MAKLLTTPFCYDKVLSYCEANGIRVSDLADKIGRSASALPTAGKRGTISNVMLRALCNATGLAESDFQPDPEPVEVVTTPPSVSNIWYTLSLSIYKDKLRLSLNFGDQEESHAWSKIKGDTRLDLLQAISYASHMLYKFEEQNQLSK